MRVLQMAEANQDFDETQKGSARPTKETENGTHGPDAAWMRNVCSECDFEHQ